MNILLIDLSSIAHPLFHVCVDPSEVSTKTVERVRALSSGNPHVGVCVEGGRSFRKDLDATYKANRPESDAVLQYQIALAIDILRADGFPILQAKGFEADDCIASARDALYATTMTNERIESIAIVSADKDLLQLVGPRVTVKSLKDGSIIDAEAVEAKFGVRPDQMLDFLALCGDASDNIKGCKDVGKVRAAGLLKKYGTIDRIFAAGLNNTDEFTPALTASLDEFRNRLTGVRDLIRLRTDAPISIDWVLKERVPLDVAEFGAEDESRSLNGDGQGDEEVPVSVSSIVPAIGLTAKTLNPAQAGQTGAGSEPVDSHQNGSLAKAPVESFELGPLEWERQLEPRNMQQMKLLAADLFASRLFSAYGHPAGVLSTILAGRELGLPAMAALRAFHVIEGKPCLAADFIRALVLQSGIVEYFRCTERSADHATFVAKRKGDPEISLTFTIEEGRKAFAGDDKKWAASGWGRNSADMCVARAGSKLARLVAPDVVSGLYAPEEFE